MSAFLMCAEASESPENGQRARAGPTMCKMTHHPVGAIHESPEQGLILRKPNSET